MSLNNSYTSKRVILASRPESTPKRTNLKLDQITINANDLEEGQILVKTHFLSVDPYLLTPMGRKSLHGDHVPNQPVYKLVQFKDGASIIDIGDVFGGRGVGEVVASRHVDYQVGDLIACDYRWQEYAILNVESELTFEKLEKDIFSKVSLSLALGVLGVSGSHALWGLDFLLQREDLQTQGKTIVVSAAAGNIGIIVSQLAKIKGMNVIGIAGGQDKVERLLNEFKLDAVVDYKQADGNEEELIRLIKKAAPNGVDAYFDNVGGQVTNAVYESLNEGARVYICGAISTYGTKVSVVVPERYAQNNKITCTTCMIYNGYLSKIPEARKEIYEYIQKGELKPVEWLTKGIENAPRVFEEMFEGKNFGKTIVEI